MTATIWVLATKKCDLLYRGNGNRYRGYPDFRLEWMLDGAVEGRAVCVTGRRKCEVLPTAKLWNGYHRQQKTNNREFWRVKPMRIVMRYDWFREGK